MTADINRQLEVAEEKGDQIIKEEGYGLLESTYQDIFDCEPALVDISWEQREFFSMEENGTVFCVDGIRFHIKDEYYEKLLDYSSTEISEYLHKFGPIEPNSLDWNNSINNFDILDLKKNTEFYTKIKTINSFLIDKQKSLLKRIFGINVKVTFFNGQLTITPLYSDN